MSAPSELNEPYKFTSTPFKHLCYPLSSCYDECNRSSCPSQSKSFWSSDDYHTSNLNAESQVERPRKWARIRGNASTLGAGTTSVAHIWRPKAQGTSRFRNRAWRQIKFANQQPRNLGREVKLLDYSVYNIEHRPSDTDASSPQPRIRTDSLTRASKTFQVKNTLKNQLRHKSHYKAPKRKHASKIHSSRSWSIGCWCTCFVNNGNILFRPTIPENTAIHARW